MKVGERIAVFFVIQLGKYNTHFVYVWDLMHCILATLLCTQMLPRLYVISGLLLWTDQSSKLILELPKDVCFFFQKSTFKRDAAVVVTTHANNEGKLFFL